MNIFLPYLLASCFFFIPLFTFASGLKSDESVILFTTQAHFNALDKQWIVPIHGWIFESETDSLWRKATIKSLGKLFGLDDDPGIEQNDLFRKRAQMFLVDNERNKTLQIRLRDQIILTEKSASNGHFYATALLNSASFAPTTQDRWLPVSLVTPNKDKRQFTGVIQLMHDTGVSVISDIDDTIKVSNVLDKKELMRNTFLREFAPVPAMSTLYHNWYEQGASFHYVSASPWQLYPALTEFLQQRGFPQGSFHMKLFRIKDESFHNLFVAPLEYKVPLISELLLQHPRRQFILVGDSGEKDPEVYQQIVQRFPGQVKHVFIRNVTNEVKSAARYQQLYQHDQRPLLTVFDNAKELLNFKL